MFSDLAQVTRSYIRTDAQGVRNLEKLSIKTCWDTTTPVEL